MKYTAFTIVLTLFLGVVQSQSAEAFVRNEVAEDISFFRDNFVQQNDQDCYKLMVGKVEQGSSGRQDVNINDLKSALAEGPSVIADGSCKAVASIESIRMLIVYNNESEIEYPVDKLADIEKTPGIAERLLYDAREVKFVDISVRDADGEVHQLADQIFFIRS